jgi:hypothetical protein
MKRPAFAGLFAAFFACCDAGSAFVHLSFSRKSAFAGGA